MSAEADAITADVAFKVRNSLMAFFLDQIQLYGDAMKKEINNDNFFAYIEGIVNAVVFFAAAAACHTHTSFLAGVKDQGIFHKENDEEFIDDFNAHVKQVFLEYLNGFRESKKH